MTLQLEVSVLDPGGERKVAGSGASPIEVPQATGSIAP